MFNTKNLVHDIKDVPEPWIFEHYCKLKEKLTGQDVKIKSLFNEEKTPSMCIYLDSKTSRYKFKDFSSGKSGSAFELVKLITGLPYYKACQQIVENYNDFVLHNNGGYDVQQFKQASKYRVKSYEVRQWSTQDQYYWTQYNIGSRLLEKYNVKPLGQYTMEKATEEGPINLTITGNYIYGYFKADGTLYKIYQPKTRDKKFIKVKDYIQGMEQTTGKEFLLITSSLKDIMSLVSLKLRIDIIAPDSENTLIPREIMDELIVKYKKIILLYDNDVPGMEAMQKVKELYPSVEIALLPLSKDPSDSIKDHGVKKVLLTLIPILDRKLG